MENISIENIDDVSELMRILHEKRKAVKDLHRKVLQINNNIKHGRIFFSQIEKFRKMAYDYEFAINWIEIDIERINNRLNDLSGFSKFR